MSADTLLRKTDIEAILDHAENCYEGLLITLAFETGARLNELLVIRVSDIALGDKIAALTLAPNTGNERTIPLVRCLPQLQEWLDEHPGGERPLLIPDTQSKSWNERFRTQKRSYGVIQGMFRKLGRKAGIDRLHPHQLRRAARHQLLKEGVTPPTVEWALGWQAPTAPVDDRDALAMFLELLEKRR